MRVDAIVVLSKSRSDSVLKGHKWGRGDPVTLASLLMPRTPLGPRTSEKPENANFV
jgi:hypothetical protein